MIKIVLVIYALNYQNVAVMKPVAEFEPKDAEICEQVGAMAVSNLKRRNPEVMIATYRCEMQTEA